MSTKATPPNVASIGGVRQLAVKHNVAHKEEDEKEQEKKGLQQFFIKEGDYMNFEAMSFQWPRHFGPLKRSQPDVAELVRTSCRKLTENAKYFEICYDFLAEYADGLCFDKINNYTTNINDFQFKLHSKAVGVFSERTMINMSCLFVMLQFGSGFTSILQKHCGGHGIETIDVGITNIYKRYGKFDVNTLKNVSGSAISDLFEIEVANSSAAASMCDTIDKCIAKIVHILTLKHFQDLADYVYHYIDISWIKAQTKNLSALKTVEWKLNKQHKIGLIFAPTHSDIVRRCVVVDYEPNENEAICAELVDRKAFVYAVNDQVIYNQPFEEIIDVIKSAVKLATSNKNSIALQFGLHLDYEPETMQTLLFNFINDFSALNDQYLYRNFYGADKHLRIYLFQSVQSIVMELYYNVYVTAAKEHRNQIFDFKGIKSLTAVVDNVIPFVLLEDGVIKIKDKFKKEFDEFIGNHYVLKTSELEVELMASAVSALELILQKRKGNGFDIAKLVFSLRNKGKMAQYAKYERHHSRGSTSKN